MMRILLFAITVGILVMSEAFAQDATFTQFYANRTYINPAYAGADLGLRFNFNYRNLWTAVPGDFSTFSGGVDIGDPNIFGNHIKRPRPFQWRKMCQTTDTPHVSSFPRELVHSLLDLMQH